ncbi:MULTISPECIES: AAA family ATPase [unclassified Modestobacter]
MSTPHADARRPRYIAPPGAATVPLPFHDELEDALTEMVDVAGAVAVHGPTGVGKTFSIQLVSARLGVPTVITRLGPRPGTTKVVRRIYADVTGHTPPLRAADAERRLEEVLGERPRILVVDEAQKLGRAGIDQLIHLHEHPDAQFTLVLIGMGLQVTLDAHEELDGRFGRSVAFQRLRDDALLAWLAAYHPLLARTAPDLLRRTDNRHWKGNLRRWAQTAHAAYNRVADPDVDGLSEDVLDDAVHAVKARPV